MNQPICVKNEKYCFSITKLLNNKMPISLSLCTHVYGCLYALDLKMISIFLNDDNDVSDNKSQIPNDPCVQKWGLILLITSFFFYYL